MSLLMWLLLIVVYLAVGLALANVVTRKVYARRTTGPYKYREFEDEAVCVFCGFSTIFFWPVTIAVVVASVFFIGLYKILRTSVLPPQLR